MAEELAPILREHGESILNGELVLSLSTRNLTTILSQLIESSGGASSAADRTFDVCPHTSDDQVGLVGDFFQRTPSLKLSHNSSATIPGHIDLQDFKTVKTLELKRVPPHLLRGLTRLHYSLVSFTVTRCLHRLRDVLDSSLSRGGGGEGGGGAPWVRLRKLYANHNFIDHLDDSLFLLPSLETLDLSHNKISSVDERLQSLKTLQHVNLGFNRLSSVPKFRSQGTQLRTLILRNNQLDNLESLEALVNVEILDLANNLLTNVSTLSPLKGLNNLRNLYLSGNPMTYISQYRTKVALCLSQRVLSIVRLDKAPFTARELKKVSHPTHLYSRSSYGRLIHARSQPINSSVPLSQPTNRAASVAVGASLLSSSADDDVLVQSVRVKARNQVVEDMEDRVQDRELQVNRKLTPPQDQTQMDLEILRQQQGTDWLMSVAATATKNNTRSLDVNDTNHNCGKSSGKSQTRHNGKGAEGKAVLQGHPADFQGHPGDIQLNTPPHTSTPVSKIDHHGNLTNSQHKQEHTKEYDNTSNARQDLKDNFNRSNDFRLSNDLETPVSGDTEGRHGDVNGHHRLHDSVSNASFLSVGEGPNQSLNEDEDDEDVRYLSLQEEDDESENLSRSEVKGNLPLRASFVSYVGGSAYTGMDPPTAESPESRSLYMATRGGLEADSSEIFLSLTDDFLVVKDWVGRTIERLELICLEKAECQSEKDGLPTLTLTFQYFNRRRQIQTFVMENAESGKSLLSELAPMVENNRELLAEDSAKLQCLKCNRVMKRSEVKVTVSHQKAKDWDTQISSKRRWSTADVREVISCPYCSSHMVVEMRQDDAAATGQEVVSTTTGESAPLLTASRRSIKSLAKLMRKDSQASISSMDIPDGSYKSGGEKDCVGFVIGSYSSATESTVETKDSAATHSSAYIPADTRNSSRAAGLSGSAGRRHNVLGNRKSAPPGSHHLFHRRAASGSGLVFGNHEQGSSPLKEVSKATSAKTRSSVVKTIDSAHHRRTPSLDSDKLALGYVQKSGGELDKGREKGAGTASGSGSSSESSSVLEDRTSSRGGSRMENGTSSPVLEDSDITILYDTDSPSSDSLTCRMGRIPRRGSASSLLSRDGGIFHTPIGSLTTASMVKAVMGQTIAGRDVRELKMADGRDGATDRMSDTSSIATFQSLADSEYSDTEMSDDEDLTPRGSHRDSSDTKKVLYPTQEAPNGMGSDTSDSLAHLTNTNVVESEAAGIGNSQSHIESEEDVAHLEFDFSDFSNVDHRLQLFLSMDVLMDGEEVKGVLKTTLVDQNTAGEHIGLLILTSTHFLLFKFSGKYKKHDLGSVLSLIERHTIPSLVYLDIAPNHQAFRLDFGKQAYAVVVREEVWCREFITMVTASVNQTSFLDSSCLLGITKSYRDYQESFWMSVELAAKKNPESDTTSSGKLKPSIDYYAMLFVHGEDRRDDARSVIVCKEELFLTQESYSLVLPRTNSELTKEEYFTIIGRHKLMDLTEVNLYRSDPRRLVVHFSDDEIDPSLNPETLIWDLHLSSPTAKMSLMRALSGPWGDLFGVDLQVNLLT